VSNPENITALKGVWNIFTPNFSNNKKTLEPVKLEKIIRDIFSIGDYYYYTVDFSSFPALSLSYVDDSVVRFFGIEKDVFTFDDVVNSVHRDDLDFIVACEKVIMFFVGKYIKAEDIQHYKFSYSFRVQDANGEYQIIQHQAMIISIGEDGTIAHSINVHTNIGHITSTPTRLMSFLGINGRPSYTCIDPYNPTFDNEGHNVLTTKELEIIDLLSRGLQTNDVAKRLNISTHTVKTHRKNMLRKLGASNTAELIQKAKEQLLF
jgi:DNA-binding CsgD family transcriptional regulator